MARIGKLRKNSLSVTTLQGAPKGPRSVLVEQKSSPRTEKLTRLREQIRQGAYHVSATEVAKAILRSEPSRESVKKKKKRTPVN